MQTLIIIGGGFAGFWAAVSAARQARTLGIQPNLRIVVITPNTHLNIRPRFYEPDPGNGRVSLANIFTPLGIKWLQGEATALDPDRRRVTLAGDTEPLPYDALVLAAGSRLKGRGDPRMTHAFNVDTLEAAQALQHHLDSLAAEGWDASSARSIVVVGAGLTGLEMATALPDRLRALGTPDAQIHLVDSGDIPRDGYAAEAGRYIRRRLKAYAIQLHPHTSVVKVARERVSLSDGRTLASRTVVLCTGLEASPLTACLPGTRMPDGRLAVAEDLSLPEAERVFVAGDAAWALAEPAHPALMSCQHAMPQGRVAGHNAVNRLFGHPGIPYRQPNYVTCVDLGGDTALFTRGWSREPSLFGLEAKTMKTRIVTEWIVPPDDPEACLAASLPEALREPAQAVGNPSARLRA